MKKTLLLITMVMAGATSVFGQGALAWGNTFTGFRAPVYGPQPGDSSASLSGQSALGTPTGSTVYGGPLLNGGGFTFALFGGPSSAVDPASLSFLASTSFRSATGNVLPAGLVTGGLVVTIPGVDAGQQAKFELRAWDNRGGTIQTWTQVLADPTILRGASGLVLSGPLGGITSGGPVSTPSSTGWSSFNISNIPEPTTLAFAGLCAAAALILRRRN
jgi:hypothetical protein